MWGMWIAVEFFWGVLAFSLEHEGNSIFLEIWAVNIVFFIINIYIGTELIKNH